MPSHVSIPLGIALTLAAIAPLAQAAPAAANHSGELLCYVGTYTARGAEGIYLFRLNPETGAVSEPQLVAKAKNPSFVAIHPTRALLYAVSEVDDHNGGKTGGVSAYSIDPETGALTLLNQQASGGQGPCHVVVDHAGKAVLVANYGSGSVASLGIESDGKLKKAASVIQQEGTSVNKQRQDGPHAHSMNLDPANRFAFAADLGADKVFVYRFDPNAATMEPNDPPAITLPPGSGPRHFAFHPSGKFAYVINELLSTVSAMSYDAEAGTLKVLQTISTLPKDFKGENTTAEVQVHPSGKFLYGSNRGHHSIAMFTIDESTGKLTATGHRPTGGETPRNFAVDPTGGWLLAENQDSDTIHLFRIDQESGDLESTGTVLEVPMPVCVKMVFASDLRERK